MKNTKSKRFNILVAIFYVMAVFLQMYYVSTVEAGELAEASVRFARMAVSVASSSSNTILIVIKPTTVGTEDDLYVTYASGITVDSTAANHTTTTTGIPSTYQGETLTAMPSLVTPALAVSGQNVTYDIGDLTVGTEYGFFVTGGITNPSSAGEKEITITTRTAADATIDTKTIAVDFVTAAADQISVTAAVPPTFNCALSANSIALGDLSSSAVVSGNVTVDIDTNANNGWVAWTKSTNTYLGSTVTSDQINTQGTVNDVPTDFISGTEFYQLNIDVTNGTGSGTPSIDAEYDGDADTGGTFSTTFEEIAISTGPGLNDGITYNVEAASSVVNESADDYTDTLTLVCSGNF